MKKQIYIIENLCCANCGAKMERKINDLPQVEEATLTFATKQISVVLKENERADDTLLLEIQKICTSMEDDVVVKERKEAEAELKKQKINKTGVFEEHKTDMAAIVVAAILFFAGQFTNNVIIYIAAYLVLGFGIVLTALKNLTKGLVFDENFLMSAATIAAFAILKILVSKSCRTFQHKSQHFNYKKRAGYAFLHTLLF